MLISDLLQDIRLELTDKAQSRFSDADLLRIVAKGVRRLGHILFRNDIEAGKQSFPFYTIPTISEYPLPDDFMKEVGIYKPNGVSLVNQTDKQWETIISAKESSVYIIRAGSIYIAGTPTTNTAMNLIYWARLDTSTLTVDDPMPYDGKFDDMIAEYVAMRAKNIDEEDVSLDTTLLSDMENQILTTYGAQTPIVVRQRGWLP